MGVAAPTAHGMQNSVAAVDRAFSLDHASVDVCVADLEAPGWPAAELEALLSDEELRRADRFHVGADRRDFVVGRGLLRSLLGRYTGSESIGLSANEWGKPLLIESAAPGNETRTGSAGPRRPVQFNVSHAGGLIVLAFGRLATVGVDVELVRDDVAHTELADRFFAPGERASMAALPYEQIPVGFFNCWTRKEAFVKAHGTGLSLPLDAFEVSLRPGDNAELLWADARFADACEWELRAFVPRPGYVAALALPRSAGSVREMWLDPASLVARPD